jgi:hypothetical protein
MGLVAQLVSDKPAEVAGSIPAQATEEIFRELIVICENIQSTEND